MYIYVHVFICDRYSLNCVDTYVFRTRDVRQLGLILVHQVAGRAHNQYLHVRAVLHGSLQQHSRLAAAKRARNIQPSAGDRKVNGF